MRYTNRHFTYLLTYIKGNHYQSPYRSIMVDCSRHYMCQLKDYLNFDLKASATKTMSLHSGSPCCGQYFSIPLCRLQDTMLDE